VTIEVNQPNAIFPLSQRHWRFLRIVLIYVYFFTFPLSFAHYAMIETWDYVGMDYPYFYNAGRNLLRGETPYPQDVIHQDPGADRAWGKYVYPPLYGWIIAPTTFLSELASKKVYVYTCIVFYFLLFVPWRSNSRSALYERWACFALICIWGPTVETFRFGQSNPVTFFSIFTACCIVERLSSETSPGWRTRAEILAGTLIGFATMIKLTPIVILPVMIVAGRWRMGVGYGLGVVLTILLTGIRTNYEYFTVVLPTMTDFASRAHFMSVNRGVIEMIHLLVRAGWLPESVSNAAPTIGMMANIALYAWVLSLVFQNRRTLTRANAVLIGCYLAPLFGSSWFHHYSLALLPVLFVMRHWIRELVNKLEERNQSGVPTSSVPKEGVRLMLLLVFIWPDFFFWTPGQAIHGFFLDVFGVSDELLVSTANLMAFLLILPVLLKPVCVPEFAWWRKGERMDCQQVSLPEPCRL
jgi:hypothetical protein